ncbi:SRPBCC family protein [Aestuariicoccus sp. MJ-SS9]|uniref:SRPBCC family protein n=1 Tax=Aestuariicoccus sp. MJ-SS9 TaxID=3079855 RepID=UPI00290E5A4C|nr:SRPBCC family protein [Aestuariicoccus sp. MJ-SS9]MDU8910442.1 SRPBCC family protein [Aestuariicoccus sp. MJ-SS9]
MEFSTREDIEAPNDRVFAAVSDFNAIERQVMRRGVEVRRIDDMTAPGPGMAWHARFRFRGKSREAEVTMTEYDPPQAMVFQTISGGLETRTELEFVALSRSRTRITMSVHLQPKTLSARLLVQSMKLARGNINKRFRVRMADYAKDLEARLKAGG